MPEQLDYPGYLGVRPQWGPDPARIGQHMMWSGPPRRDQRVSDVAWERQVGDGSVQMPQLTASQAKLDPPNTVRTDCDPPLAPDLVEHDFHLR